MPNYTNFGHPLRIGEEGLETQYYPGTDHAYFEKTATLDVPGQTDRDSEPIVVSPMAAAHPEDLSVYAAFVAHRFGRTVVIAWSKHIEVQVPSNTELDNSVNELNLWTMKSRLMSAYGTGPLSEEEINKIANLACVARNLLEGQMIH